MINEIKEGDIVKRDFTSRQSWIIESIEGKLMAVPTNAKFHPSPDPIEITDDMIRLNNIRGIDFSKNTDGWNLK
jgi:hypothetical protein